MIILITGITSGFGRAMAESLSKEGHAVYGTHRHAKEFLPGVHYIQAEVTDDTSVEAAVNEVLKQEGRIDVFINNAGMGFGGPLECCSIEQARRQMDVNWLGMVRFLHHVVPAMRKQRSGKILCISSIGGLIGLPFQGLYSASKFAIEGYCEALRLELRDFRVKVIVIEPGDFHTNFTSSRQCVDPASVANYYPKYARSLESFQNDETNGMGPDVLAKKVVRIVSKKNPRNSYVISNFIEHLAVFAKKFLPSKLFAVLVAWFYKV